ncbi:6-phospho-beta-glucosidase [Tamaricihabitans halophyticus]|uniref:6-phospho-beta-glucosidase n=1 Tax=Tamaricihabitans halophyticus TaxID=1262583 RepID=A0A4R2R6H8_9PSEU|nr:6-phospho-beta-glucosidase [Tamaricihabitans halophyticus]TCP54945.1 6-phospho-beta-glucosidase [Tamaricihabitans halophyticus]
MKLVVLGGGGFRVPLIHASLLDDPDRLVDELVLHDVDESRLQAIVAVLDGQAAGRAWRPKLRVSTDLDTALGGADIVFSAIRVGGLAGRTRDERVALEHGLLGQETVGVGGICYGLRTIPIALDIAERIRRLAPDAWLINFTNPAGMVTEAVSAVLGDRVVGICDSPVGLCRRVAAALEVPYEQTWFDYVGLNHLGWLRGALVHGKDRLPDLLTDDVALASFEEGRLFGASWLRTLGAIPNEYLHYYYFARESVAQLENQQDTRGEFLHRQQADFYARATEQPAEALAQWQRTRAEREHTYLAEAREIAGAGERTACDVDGGGYERVAYDLMSAIVANRPSTLILNVRNRSAVSTLDPNAIVELPCLVDGNGPRPIATGGLDGATAGLVQQVKAVERTTIEAAVSRSRRTALRALAEHPLVDSVAAAESALDGYRAAFPELADLR